MQDDRQGGAVREAAREPVTWGMLALLAARWAQVAEPFRETDFEPQDPWFEPGPLDPAPGGRPPG